MNELAQHTKQHLEDQLEERFLRYTRIASQSAFNQHEVPSTKTQWDMAQALMAELKGLGIKDVQMDDFANVTAIIKGNKPGPKIGYVAHIDTVDVGLSDQIKAQKIHHHGGDIVLNKALGLLFDKQNHPEVDRYIGEDIFFSDGTSVLGADNKAAISVVMTMIENALKGEFSHPDLYVAFVSDEEIGLKGAKKLDLTRFCPDYAYTIDCCERGEIVYETFNAASADIRIQGVTAHPMSAKGVLVNPTLIASDLMNLFDRRQTPEQTEGREGYIWFTDLVSNQASATLTAAIRDHDLVQFDARKNKLKQAVKQMQALHPTAKLSINITNMYANISNSAEKDHPAIQAIYQAFADQNIEPITIAMRGGTDGSALSAKGLVTPNYFTGAHNFHSKYEFLPMSAFVDSYKVTICILENAIKNR